MSQEPQKRYLTLPEVSDMLSIPLKVIQGQVCPNARTPLTINGQKVRVNRIGRRVRIDREEIERLLRIQG